MSELSPEQIEAEEALRRGVVAKLKEPFDSSLIKQRTGFNNTKLDYVAGHTVIYRTMAATNDNFDLRITVPPIIQEMTESYRNKSTGKTETRQVFLVIVGVEVTIPGLGSRSGLGVQKMNSVSEDLVKGALTDAFKNAMKFFGVALHLYGSDDEGVNEANF